MPVRFYLHNKATESRHPIYIEVRWAKHPAAEFGTTPVVRMGVRDSVLKKHWTSKQRVSTQDQRATRINRKLGKLYTIAEDLLSDAQRDKQKVTPEQMRTALLLELNLVEAPSPTPVAAELEAPVILTIAQVAAEWKTFYKAKHTPNYLRKIDPVAMHWEAFRPGTTLEELLPDPKTKRSDLVEQWCNYLIDEAPTRTGGVGLESNTVGRYLKGLRALLKYAGHPFAWLADEYSYEVEIEPLKFEEVLQLYEVPMPTEHLRHVRDVFVFNCFTGPRFGNLRALEPSDVVEDRGDYILEYVQFKGQRKKLKVRVMLDEIPLEIWQRYQGRLPVPVSQEMNESIKEAAQAAGLTRQIKQVRQRGPHRVERRGPLWEFITAHVARHTFATMLLDGDADLGQVQDSLGHSAIQTTRRYAKSREQKRHQATKSAFLNLRSSHTESPGV